MSEIKPWGYIHNSATRTLRDRALCNSTITNKATANSDMPLFTADELAEAVAAERERCLRPIIEMSQKWDGGISDDLRSAIQTIRSTTK